MRIVGSLTMQRPRRTGMVDAVQNGGINGVGAAAVEFEVSVGCGGRAWSGDALAIAARI